MLSLLFLHRIDNQSIFRIIVTLFSIILSTIVLLFCLSFGQGVNNSIVRQGQLGILDSYRNRNDPNLKPCANCIAVNKRFVANYPEPPIVEYSIKRYSDQSPFILGINRIPSENEAFISSGLKSLIEKNPKISSKYQKYQLIEGQIDETKLPYRNSAVAIIALPEVSFQNLVKAGTAFLNEESFRLYRFSSNTGTSKIINAFMLLCGLGLIFPLLVLIVSATRIGMLQRQHRYAALSLLGTSKRQINLINFTETALTTAVGVIIGLIIFLLSRNLVASNFSFNGNLLHFSDFILPFHIYFVIISLIFLLVFLVNWWAMRKVKSSPLGVVRNQKIYRRPKIFSAIPLLISFTLLILSGVVDKKPDSTGLVMIILLISFLFAMIGVIAVGPFITFTFGKIINLFSRRPSLIIASRRISVHSRVIFQGISGIVLALFVGSFFIGSLATFRSLFKGINHIDDAKDNFAIMDAQFRKPGIKFLSEPSTPTMSFVSSIPELKQFDYEIFTEQSASAKLEGGKDVFGVIYSCDQLEKITYLSCENSYKNKKDYRVLLYFQINSGSRAILNYVPLKSIKKNPRITTVYYFQDIATRDRAFEIIRNYMLDYSRLTLNDISFFSSPKFSAEKEIASLDKTFGDLVSLIYIGTVATIIVGGFSLAVSTIGSFFERKKSFINLRLMGTEKRTLYVVVFIETISAMIIATIISILSGTVFAWYTIKSIAQNNLKTIDVSKYFSWPEPIYFFIVIASLLVSFLIVFSILPILNNITNPRSNRTE